MKALQLIIVLSILMINVVSAQKLSISSAIAPLSTSFNPVSSPFDENTSILLNELDVYEPFDPNIRWESKNDTANAFQISPENVLPHYIRNNPSGNTFLCNLEDEIEDNAVIPIWVQVGDDRELFPVGSAHVQIKMLRF